MAEPWATGRGAFGLELGALTEVLAQPGVADPQAGAPVSPLQKTPGDVQRIEGDQVASKSSFDR